MTDRKEAKISEVRNETQPMAFVVTFNNEDSKQFPLTPEALELLEEHDLVPTVDARLGLNRKKWKEAMMPKSSGSVFGFSETGGTIGKRNL